MTSAHDADFQISFYTFILDDNTGISHVFEMRIRMKKLITTFLGCFSSSEKSQKKFRPERGFEPRTLRYRCSAQPVEPLGQLRARRYGVDYKPVDMEIDDDNTGIFQAFLAAAKAAQKCDHQFHSLLSFSVA